MSVIAQMGFLEAVLCDTICDIISGQGGCLPKCRNHSNLGIQRLFRLNTSKLAERGEGARGDCSERPHPATWPEGNHLPSRRSDEEQIGAGIGADRWRRMMPESLSPQDLYAAHLKQAWEDIQSSTDSFDRNLLNLSSAALGVSLVFLKELVPLSQARALPLLYSSWVLFAICIVTTVLSFRFSIAAQSARIPDLFRYYIKGDNTALNRKTFATRALRWCTEIGTYTFVSGIGCTLSFVVTNLLRSPR